MSARSRTGSRRLAWLVLAVVALPVLMAGVRVVTHFAADFDEGFVSSQTFWADGGTMMVAGPDHVYELGQDGPQDGVMQVLPNPGAQPALLLADLDEAVEADMIHVDFDVAKFGDWSPLVLWLNDSDGGGMIDVTFERPDQGEPPIRVDGQPVPLPAMKDGDERLHVRLTLKQPTIGMPNWTVVLTSELGSTTMSGPLFTGGEEPSIGSLVFVRPGASFGGSYELDDVIVSSQGGGLISNP